MKIVATTIVVLGLCAGAASAQNLDSSSTSGSQSLSTSGVLIEGSIVPNNTPSIGGGSANSTAPCVVGRGGGIAGPGFGVHHHNGKVNKDCETRIEIDLVAQIAAMRPGPAKTAAALHACTNDESIEKTLAAMGLCPVTKPTKTATAQATEKVAPYSFCGINDAGQFVVRKRWNATSADARAACAKDYRANGGVNIGR